MAYDPLSPSEALRTRAGTVLAVVSLLVLVYSLVIAQLLLGVIVGVALPAGLYLSYRLFAALDALADAAQRIADGREREADEASQSSNRLTERER